MDIFLEDDPMKHYYNKIELKNSEGDAPIVLDPFMGGGTTIVEGHRLGCKMIGVDLNPLPWFITKKELEFVDTKTIEKTFSKIRENVKDRILSYYKTTCKNKHAADIMYVFWAKELICENCSKNVPLYKSFVVAKPEDHWVYQCPSCGEIFENDTNLRTVECPACAATFNPNQGFVVGKTYKCKNCRYEGETLSAIQKEKTPPRHLMYAIEYLCPKCGRDFKKPESEDLELYNRAEKELEDNRSNLLGRCIPDQQIEAGEKTRELLNRNYHYWHEMFNSRQLVCLSLLLEEILGIKDQKTREFFMITFSDSLNANNMFTIYNSTALKLEPLFGGHHFWPPDFPVEGNVWGAELGRGSFEKYFLKGLKAISYQAQPYEIWFKDKNGKYGETNRETMKVDIEGDSIDGKFAESFDELKQEKDILLRCDTAENLDFISNAQSVDAVVTDPPYFDNIMYSELSDFFYVWLRLGLKDRYPNAFTNPLTRKDREILVNRTQGKDEDFYVEGMARVFHEAFRVLKNGGILAFVFQHKRTEAWSSILKAIMKSGFYVIAVYPTHGETPSGMRKYGINYNSILVCKKRLVRKHQNVPWVIFESELRSGVDSEISRLIDLHPGIEVEDAFIIAMGKALQVYSMNYGDVLKDGQIFDVSELTMELIGDIVFDSLLKHILKDVPDVDRISKIYGSIFARKEKVSNDTVNKLTRNGGISVAIFEKDKLLERNGIKSLMKITAPEDRLEFIRSRIDAGIPLTYIDGAHFLWSAKENNSDFGNALELILRNGIDRNRLGQFLLFLAERTGDVTWRKIENSFQSFASRTLDGFDGGE